MLFEIDRLKARWDELQPISHERAQNLWERFRLSWNYNANHIGGNTMSYAETELLFHLGDQFKAQNNSLRSVYEMQAHDLAIHLIRDWAADSQRQLTEKDILELHRIILVKDFWTEIPMPDGVMSRQLFRVGEYKSLAMPSYVNQFQQSHSAPEDVPNRMNDLISWYAGVQEEHPVVVAALLHYNIAAIRPFDDGNGRISWLLMNYHLMKNGYPPVIIKSADKEDYLDVIQQAEMGNKNALVNYIVKQIAQSLHIALAMADMVYIVKSGDILTIVETPIHIDSVSNLERSDECIQQIYADYIFAVFSKIYQESSVFKEVFAYHIAEQGYKLASSDLLLPIHKLNESAFNKGEADDYIEKIRQNIIFSNDSDGIHDGLRLISSVDFHFHPYYYTISFDDTPLPKQYVYSHKFNEEEIAQIADEVIKRLFAKVSAINS